MTKRILAGVMAVGAAAALVRAHGWRHRERPACRARRSRQQLARLDLGAVRSGERLLLLHEAGWRMPMAELMAQEESPLTSSGNLQHRMETPYEQLLKTMTHGGGRH